jgi:hypothetical protein
LWLPWLWGRDPGVCRQILHLTLHALPPKAARELRAIVRPLDETYLARAIPTPDNVWIRNLLTVTLPHERPVLVPQAVPRSKLTQPSLNMTAPVASHGTVS